MKKDEALNSLLTYWRYLWRSFDEVFGASSSRSQTPFSDSETNFSKKIVVEDRQTPLTDTDMPDFARKIVSPAPLKSNSQHSNFISSNFMNVENFVINRHQTPISDVDMDRQTPVEFAQSDVYDILAFQVTKNFFFFAKIFFC